MDQKNMQAPAIKPEQDQQDMIVEETEATMANEQMDREFNGEEQEEFRSEIDAGLFHN